MSELGVYCFACIKIGEPADDGEHFIEFAVTSAHVEISFPNAATVAPDADRELVESASTIKVPHDNFLAAMSAFCGAIVAIKPDGPHESLFDKAKRPGSRFRLGDAK